MRHVFDLQENKIAMVMSKVLAKKNRDNILCEGRSDEANLSIYAYNHPLGIVTFASGKLTMTECSGLLRKGRHIGLPLQSSQKISSGRKL
ncbi:MAG: hypothetical protein A2Y62_06165 [Candidatus Fischerbacteria bacterium RBG_13_37_8]|uniref:Uncharacterized protein n=1 Tax=Candidatus Fischerbacteria bacterium RBG_13_37_8 TaxID=1817863 RepID=A0A1F5VVT8_9BACT|nr:MAG: hypothetical protein A2Y62_06165 [Candidatus Fischerbacteria bacterium RBG_13_37_8]